MLKGKAWKAGIAALLLVMVLAGCGGANNPAGETPGKTTEKPAKPTNSPDDNAQAADAPVEFSWIGAYILGKDTMAQKYLEEKLNVKITPTGIDRSNWEQQINVKLAAGEKPDFFGNLDISMYHWLTYVKQELIGEIPVEVIRQHAPNYAKMVDEMDKTAWDISVIDGKNYGIPKFYGEGGSPFVPAYNEAWLKKIGYNEPPKTLEELEDVLTKFRNDDPDGNGKKDTYGISARGKDTLASNQIFNTVFAAHGITPSGWVEQPDGKVKFGFTTEEARTALKLLNKWYKDGIIDPEFITDDWNSYRAKFAGGKIGMLDQALWYHDHSSGQVGQDSEKAGMKMVVGKPVIGTTGKMMGIAQGYKQVPFSIGVEAAKDPKKVEAILKVLDLTATNEEAYLMTGFGIEGEHYDMVDGGPVQRPEYTDPAKAASALGLNFFNPAKSNPSMIHLDYPSDKLAFKEQVNDPDIIRIIDKMQMRILPTWDANKDAFTKMLKEYELKFIVGEVDLDQGFDDFVAEMNKIGLDKATEEANEIYANIPK
ncbi:extracellular solute-binding protein [Paenibacillaceae bacterium]|nr:extracellular solute-binding protein [Paenibacillaceae bacterium]